MPAKIRLSDDVREVLSRSVIDASTVGLPGQLDRDLYLRVDKVLRAAGGKWNRSARKHVFAVDPREALGLALETGEVVDRKVARKVALQAFYTPPEVATYVAELADVQRDQFLLEPSAGEGALLDAVKEQIRTEDARTLHCLAYEIDPYAIEALRGKGYNTIYSDFLEVAPVPHFDRIVMNPPFTRGLDVRHVTHALQFLASGGRLVAITSPGWRTRRYRASVAFRELLGRYKTEVRELPEGAFKSSGTAVRTIVLVVENCD